MIFTIWVNNGVMALILELVTIVELSLQSSSPGLVVSSGLFVVDFTVGPGGVVPFPDVDFKAHSCEVAPPNVPSHPLLISVHPGFIVQHIPCLPHQSQRPCTALQRPQQSSPALWISFASTRCNVAMAISIAIASMRSRTIF